MAKKKLYLEQILDERRERLEERAYKYVVTKVVGATSPSVWDELAQREAQAFCDREDWEVTITGYGS